MELKIIRGGKEDTILTSRKVFLEAYATNTRLMGVTACHAIFSLPDNLNYKFAHMFFYFDSEEFYFDTYERVLSKSLKDQKTEKYINEISSRMMGGLGGELVKISEKELSALVTHYYHLTTSNNDEVPDGYDEYSFLIDDSLSLDDYELNSLFDKICESISCDYQVVNYFLMRTVGHDLVAAKYLTKGNLLNLDIGLECGSFLKNKIKEFDSNMNIHKDDAYFTSFDTVKSYFCESLIENKGYYYILTSEILVSNLKITSFKLLSSFRITEKEADLMTKRTEYLSLYEYSFPVELISSFNTKLSKYAMTNYHENGILYMIFNKTNDHVKNPVFNIADDVLGVQYLTKYNQLILLAYSKEKMKDLKKDLKSFSLYSDLEHVEDFVEDNPIFYSFVNANYEDLRDYLEDISE